MSRSRNIKPGFFRNEVLVTLPFEFRLLFIGLWTMADREGRMEDRPMKIRMELFPADSVDVDHGLSRLHEAGFICRYFVGETRYIQILAWGKHQNPHVKEAASTIPAPGKPGANTVSAQKSPERAGLIPDSLNLIPDSLEKPSVQPSAARDEVFDQAWAGYPKRAGSNSRADALKAWRVRVKSGESASEMLAGTLRYADFVTATGKSGTEFVMQAARFYGPGKHYANEWRPPDQRETPRKPSRTLSAINTLQSLKIPETPNDDTRMAPQRTGGRPEQASLPALRQLPE